MFRAAAMLLPLLPLMAFVPSLDANGIIRRSVKALKRDWNASPHYNYFERDVEDHGTKTYQVLMILGSSYRRLVKVNGAPLSAADQKKEQDKLDEATAKRRAESSEQRKQRVAEFQKERRRDHQLMAELTRAFVFKRSGEATLNAHRVYVLTATPRPGYRPTNKETEVLTGMRGTLWVDKASFQWVKAQAEVIHPVSIDGFLAKVEPGTQFELEKAPVSPGVWLPSHFAVQSKAEILSFIPHGGHQEETYFNYQRAGQPAAAIPRVR